MRMGSYIGHRNVLGVPPLAHMSPGALSDFFDDCIRSENDRTDEYEIEFDYRSLMPHTASCRQTDDVHEEDNSISSEMEAIAYIAKNRALKPLLKHPLMSSFLYLKWHRIRHVLYANLIFYVVFYALMNIYIVSTNRGTNASSSSSPNASNLTSTIVYTSLQQLHGLGALAAVFLILLAVRETFQLLSSPGQYISSFENMLELSLIVLGAWALVAPNPQVGALVILLSAWELVILIGQHPRMSTGIEMFKTVTMNFIKFLFLYAFLILAFALAFFMLFYNANNENFPDPGSSLFKTIIMLTGEFDANDIPFVSHPIFSRCIFVLFVFLIAIVLFNLLNGLAVSDTADILNRSELVALISRAKLVSYAERVAVGSELIRSKGQCCSARTVRRSICNPLGFIARRILLFPRYLPQGKLGVKPYKSNQIRAYGRTRKTTSCTDWSMDPLIVGRAREILSRRGDITENEKIIAELGAIKNKLERLETVIDGMRLVLQNNNIRSNSED